MLPNLLALSVLTCNLGKAIGSDLMEPSCGGRRAKPREPVAEGSIQSQRLLERFFLLAVLLRAVLNRDEWVALNWLMGHRPEARDGIS